MTTIHTLTAGHKGGPTLTAGHKGGPTLTAGHKGGPGAVIIVGAF